MQAAQDAGQHFLYANMADAQSKQEVLERHRRRLHLSGALRQEPRCAVRLHDRPGARRPGSSRASSSCSSSCPTTRASTARRASNCSTSSAMRPTSGRSEKYHSGASILFSSPLPGNRVMGAGDGDGPQSSSSNEGGSKSKSAAAAKAAAANAELRHEHAADEQRVRHGDVVERRLTARVDPHDKGWPRPPLFHGRVALNPEPRAQVVGAGDRVEVVRRDLLEAQAGVQAARGFHVVQRVEQQVE